jgi:hypothetical protein
MLKKKGLITETTIKLISSWDFATMAKLNREFDKMVIANGKIDITSQIYRGGIGEVILNSDVIEQLERNIMEGMEHPTINKASI